MDTKSRGPKPHADGRTSRAFRIAVTDEESAAITHYLTSDLRREILLAWIQDRITKDALIAEPNIVNHDDAVLVDYPNGKKVLFK